MQRIAPNTIELSKTATFVIRTPDAGKIKSVALLRCGSSTHAFDPDQRYVGLAMASVAKDELVVAAPPNRNVAPPGYYLLFVVDTDGVPSVGSFVLVK